MLPHNTCLRPSYLIEAARGVMIVRNKLQVPGYGQQDSINVDSLKQIHFLSPKGAQQLKSHL